MEYKGDPTGYIILLGDQAQAGHGTLAGTSFLTWLCSFSSPSSRRRQSFVKGGGAIASDGSTTALRAALEAVAASGTIGSRESGYARRFKKLATAAGLPEIDLHDVRHSYATAGRDTKID